MLPIHHITADLLAALKTQSQIILQAPPGSGKSTVLPLILLEQAGLNGKILMLEPRRLAVRNVALRLAEQKNEKVGQTIGYRIRSEQHIGSQTQLEVITEGILTHKLQRDPSLEDVSLVILDEFHERSLQADLALTLLLDVQQGLRDDLKILIMSATLDNRALCQFLPQAKIISVEGYAYPVTSHYVSLPQHKRFEQAVAEQIYSVIENHAGSMLVFLPGAADIKRVEQNLASFHFHDEIIVHALYGALSFEQQKQAILPSQVDQRKIVLATNIAETSLTIEGITLVIDSGLEKVAVFDPRNGLTRLVTQRISKSSMIQRAGRAGRLSPGSCWHLFSKEQADRLADHAEPAILQCDLTDLWLELLMWGCTSPEQLQWLTFPPKPALNYANHLLQQLHFIDEKNKLTLQGQEAAQLPCEPRIAAMLIYAQQRGKLALSTACLLAAILEEPPKQGISDLAYWLQHPLPFWLKRAKQLAGLLQTKHKEIALEELPYLLIAAYPDRIAKRRGHSANYLLANGSGAMLFHEDALSAYEWLIAPTILKTEADYSARILLATQFDINAILSDFSKLVTEKTAIEWHEAAGTLKTVNRQSIGQIVLSQTYLAKPSKVQLQHALLNWIQEQGLSKLNWDESAIQLRTRLLLAKEWLPEYNWPEATDNALLNKVDVWLQPSLENVQDVKGLRTINLSKALERLLDWQQKSLLDDMLPATYQVPTGSKLALQYFIDKPPVLSVRLQEMFGEQRSPNVAKGKVNVTLALLSPAQRLLQVTSDLSHFWQNAYQDVKKEMKGRYPKHVWPDDPANTQPTRLTKKFHK